MGEKILVVNFAYYFFFDFASTPPGNLLCCYRILLELFIAKLHEDTEVWLVGIAKRMDKRKIIN